MRIDRDRDGAPQLPLEITMRRILSKILPKSLFPAATVSGTHTRQRLLSRGLRVELLEGRRVFAALPFGASQADLGEFLLGSVAVTPVLLDSNGQLDPSTENWTPVQIQQTLANIDEGLGWWVDTLAAQNSVHELSFNVDTTYATTPAETRYEPISRRSNDYSLYVAEFLANVGFGTGNLETDIRSFNQSQREKLNTDWSFSIFVVPSFADADGQFAPGGSFSRAFAFAGGLFMIIPSTRPASTYTHETGHMFWARDEYAGGGSYFQRRGYYDTVNSNAADNPTPGFVQQPSIMAAGSLLETAYTNHVSPETTLAMLGWQDSDGDGIFDVLDVPHQLTGNGYFDVESGNYRFSGFATVQTLPNLNSSGLKNDITINRIREIEYRFDGGNWQVHSMPDDYQVNLDLTIPVPTGVTEIEIRARDSKTTVVSNSFVGRLTRADATLVPGINGFTWIDGNQNGLRDLGEFGAAGWTVELVDNNGVVLELQESIEPDDFPDGVLQSGFSAAVSITSVGTDADGRVAVFSDQGASTSTGTKNFRGFSRGSQTFLSTWTSASRRLQVDFATNNSSVSIDAIGAFNNSFARMEAFNSNGELLGRYTTSRLDVGSVETMTIQRGVADIAYVIIGGHANTSIKLDNLQFGPEATQTTGANGMFAFPALPANDYLVRVAPGAGFRAKSPQDGTLTATVSTNSAATDIDFGFEVATSQWQNPREPLDVNDDNNISALDVLLIVNEINANGTRNLQGTNVTSPPYIDVTGDSLVSAVDVLTVINFINQRGNGEGETLIAASNLSYCVGLPVGRHSAGPSLGEGEFSAPSVELAVVENDEDDADEPLLALLALEQLKL
jgi:hypothetical protein